MRSDVQVRIYNVLGQEIRTLVHEQLEAGFHYKVWDGANSAGLRVASGIYLYQIRAGSFVVTKKMVVLK